MEKEQLYERLNEDSSLSDSERREIYFAEISQQEGLEDWQNNYH